MKRSWIGVELPGRGGAQQVVVADAGVGAGGRRDLAALRPFDLDRRHREEQRAREIAARADRRTCAMASSAARSASRSDSSGADSGSAGTKSTVPAKRGLQAVGGEARDGLDAGLAGGELLPVVGLAGAERGDDAHAGDDDDRASGAVVIGRHDALLQVALRPAPGLRRANGRRR